MTHIRKDAPEGYIYRVKGTLYDFVETIFLGAGMSIENYELIPLDEYERLCEEERKEMEAILNGRYQ